MNRSLTAMWLALTVVFGFAGCMASSPEALRKEAQSNSDKYVEFLKAGDFESAYAKSMHADYRRQMPIETFVRYRQGLEQTFGAIESYQVVHYDADPERQSVTLTYAVKYSKAPEPGSEIVKLRREGTEWRVTSIEPKMPQKAPIAPDITMPGMAPTPQPQPHPTEPHVDPPK